MATLPIYNKLGEEVGSYDIDPDQIAPKISKQLLHDAIVMYQTNKRQGSAKTKSRAEVAGSVKKMYRQKGTGHARAGTRKSGIRRGGGHIFAKRPKDWSYRMPRKALQTATRMAVASRIKDSEIVVIDELSFDAPKTVEMVRIMKALSLDCTCLTVVENYDVNIYKSVRNIQGVNVLPVAELNAYDVLRPKKMLITKQALEAFAAKAAPKQEAAA
jgi:large subunit ribosomal protein L4